MNTNQQERKTHRVYLSGPNGLSTDERRDYLAARFNNPLATSFEWNGHRYRYLHTDFDETGDFDVLLCANTGSGITVPNNYTSVTRDFIYSGRETVPIVTVCFPVDNFDARDAFAAALNGSPSQRIIDAGIATRENIPVVAPAVFPDAPDNI